MNLWLQLWIIPQSHDSPWRNCKSPPLISCMWLWLMARRVGAAAQDERRTGLYTCRRLHPRSHLFKHTHTGPSLVSGKCLRASPRPDVNCGFTTNPPFPRRVMSVAAARQTLRTALTSPRRLNTQTCCQSHTDGKNLELSKHTEQISSVWTSGVFKEAVMVPDSFVLMWLPSH